MANKKDLKIRPRKVSPQEDKPDLVEKATPAEPQNKRKKRRRQRSVVWAVLARLLVLVGIVLAGVLFWNNWDRIAPASFVEWVDRLFTGGEGGDGYPVDITGSGVVSMQPMGSNAVVLTDTSLTIYNSAGAQIANRPHTYADPMMKVQGEYILNTELGGTRYSLSKKKEDVLSGQVANAIVSAAVDKKGRIALATESSQSYLSEVIVYKRDGKEIFHWYSADLTVMDVAFDPHNDTVAVLGLSAQGGNMVSTLHLFSLSGKETAATHTYTAAGAMMTALQYFDNGRVAAVGDTATWVYDPDSKKVATVTYEDAVLMGYTFSSKGIGLVTRGFGESGGGRFFSVSTTGEEKQEMVFSEDFRHVSAAEDGFYLLTETTVYHLDNGGMIKQTPSLTDGLMVVEMNGKPLILSLTSLTRCTWE